MGFTFIAFFTEFFANSSTCWILDKFTTYPVVDQDQGKACSTVVGSLSFLSSYKAPKVAQNDRIFYSPLGGFGGFVKGGGRLSFILQQKVLPPPAEL